LSELAVSDFVFGAVIIIVGVVGFIAGIVTLIRNEDLYKEIGNRGAFSIFKPPSDHSPRPAPGTRLEDRHELDPQPPPGKEAP
jgi:hypothetical protein